MNASVSPMHTTPLSLQGKLRLLVACVVAGGVFWPLGHFLFKKPDPLSPLVLFGPGNVIATWGCLTALAAVVAALGTVLIGRYRQWAGLFTAAIGLAVFSWRNGTVQDLLETVGADPKARAGAFGSLLGEILLWAVMMAVVGIVEGVLRRWLGGDAAPAVVEPSKSSGKTNTPEWALGLLAVGLITVIAVVILSQLMARDATALVNRKQVYFALAVAFFLSSWIVCRFVPNVADAWYLFSPAVVAALGYLWAWTQPVVSGHPFYVDIPQVPPNFLVRALPVEYLSVGLAGAIFGVWAGRSTGEPMQVVGRSAT